VRFRYSSFNLALAVFCLAPTAYAQTRLEGNIVQSENGYSVPAKIWVESPDKIKIEVGKVTVVGAEDRTQIFDASTRRLRVYDWNFARQWTRGTSLEFGGPANFALFGVGATTAKDSGAIQVVRDQPLFGGGSKTAYYATRKTPTARYPLEVEVSKTARIERGLAGAELRRYALTFEGEVPKSAALGEVKWNYDLKSREEAFDANFWKIAGAEGAIPEAQDLAAPSSYGDDDFNRAMALWRGTADLDAALAALNSAQNKAPKATAPLLAKFEIQLLRRDDENAQTTLEAIEKLGIDRASLELLNARLSELQRDYVGAREAADSAAAAAPENWDLKFQSAIYARLGGEIAMYRTRMMEFLKAENAPHTLRVLAAGDMARFALPTEFNAIKTAITGTSEPERLAKALISLRQNQDSTEVFLTEAAQTAMALGLERAGKDEAAQSLWERLTKSTNAALANRAQFHLMVLASRRGDAAASINALHAIKLELEQDKANANSTFFDTWQKSFRRLALEKTLQSRASATRTTELDMRLYADYVLAYDTPAEQEKVYDTGFTRYKTHFWGAKLAEFQVANTRLLLVIDPVERAKRDGLYAKAFASLDAASKAEPDQPYYRMQKVLATSQRIANLRMADARRSLMERDAARKEVDALLTAFPNDPDAKITAAIALSTFDGETAARRIIELATSALDSAPVDGDRQMLIFAARQTIALTQEKLNNFNEAARQFEILLASSRDATEQANVAGVYIDFLQRIGGGPTPPAALDANGNPIADAGQPTNNAAAIANVVIRVAGEKWDFEKSKLLLDAISRRALLSPLRNDIMREVRNNGGSPANMAWATMAGYRLEAAKNALAKPDAPASADAELERAERELSGAMGVITQLANSQERIMAARACVFLAQRGGLSPVDGIKYLRRAADLEPRDLSLQLSLIESLGIEGASGEEAKKRREQISLIFDLDVEASRQLALLAWFQKDDALAALVSEESYNVAARSPEANVNQFQRSAFSWARIAATTAHNAKSVELYNNLAGEQWGLIDRTAALLGQRQRITENGGDGKHIDERIRVLGLDMDSLQSAANYLVQLEN
jgi:hypothetical protein